MSDVDDIAAFCAALPKVELHAHLNGSLSKDTLSAMLAGMDPSLPVHAEFAEFERQCSLVDLDSFFPLFGFLYQITSTAAAVRAVTRRVVHEFAADQCAYLELRSTPRANADTGMTKASYVQAVLDGTDDAVAELAAAAAAAGRGDGARGGQDADGAGIQVRWILSIDRRHSLETSLDTVDLAVANMHRGVVGVDLCGDPLQGDFKTLEPAFRKARDAGLKVTLHMAEVENTEQETLDMIDFGPDRIGHGTFLLGALRSRVVDESIPIEVCVTSNIVSKTVKTIQDHHFSNLHIDGHPCILCTDDKGVFRCSLSGEYATVAKHFGLSRADLFRLARGSIDHIFADETVKQRLRQRIDAFGQSQGISICTLADAQ
ncbi:hypothetical protein BC831DRAFT_476145 [Entophlyctis helioformis]|nr:hypothetical protein BC831DRAFT_476145 [Entophlyctis helioformis]